MTGDERGNRRGRRLGRRRRAERRPAAESSRYSLYSRREAAECREQSESSHYTEGLAVSGTSTVPTGQWTWRQCSSKEIFKWEGVIVCENSRGLAGSLL